MVLEISLNHFSRKSSQKQRVSTQIARSAPASDLLLSSLITIENKEKTECEIRKQKSKTLVWDGMNCFSDAKKHKAKL